LKGEERDGGGGAADELGGETKTKGWGCKEKERGKGEIKRREKTPA